MKLELNGRDFKKGDFVLVPSLSNEILVVDSLVIGTKHIIVKIDGVSP